RSALYSAREQSGDEVALNENVKKDERERYDDENSKESARIGHVHSRVLHRDKSDRFVFAVSHHNEGQKELVPCNDELPDRNKNQSRLHQGQRNVKEHLQ